MKIYSNEANVVIFSTNYLLFRQKKRLPHEDSLQSMYISKDYFVALSKRFIMTNMKSAEIKQSAMNTVHTDHNGRPAQRKPPTATSMLPIAVATNQPPIIKPLSFGDRKSVV